jgi:hypothetical protein
MTHARSVFLLDTSAVRFLKQSQHVSLESSSIIHEEKNRLSLTNSYGEGRYENHVGDQVGHDHLCSCTVLQCSLRWNLTRELKDDSLLRDNN